LIGDTRGAALVSRNADMDWLCVPRFDSQACFAALLGRDEHGRWGLRPTSRVRSRSQRYRPDTMVLETTFDCAGGSVRVIDFMPVTKAGKTDGRSDVVRVVEGLSGAVELETRLEPRFGYGACLPWVQSRGGQEVSLTAGPDALHLRSTVPVATEPGLVSATFTVAAGESAAFVLSWSPADQAIPAALDPLRALADTEAYWRDWAGRCAYQGRWRDAVRRSLLTLKALTYAPTGAIVAAPTTSLPEELGGVRNWDYRYCWLRDSGLTLHAFMVGGYADEARAYRDWLARTVSGDPSKVQIMYGISGERRLTEESLDWLPGYEESRPVRVGNGAWDQFQLDVYGETLSCLYAARKLGMPEAPEAWDLARGLLTQLERLWQRPDEGIWEVRGEQTRHFTHSKVEAWVAVDRAIGLIEEFALFGDDGPAMLPHLRTLRERIRDEVLERAWHPGVGAYTQAYGSAALDASVLVMPLVGFLDADDPRMVSTVEAIEKSLMRGGLVRRYDTSYGYDGLPGDESPFLACSFWLADVYALQGRTEEAEALFERLLGLRNELGLLAEEYDPSAGRHIGNFPQGFSHLTLVQTAHLLDSGTSKRSREWSPTPRPPDDLNPGTVNGAG
ncbi:MAG: glycoside hydrolase family 15 protein, partial [Catenulispora sp.]|nr:glycoside hydrolase family 15 protein [Catenulispora sp.]